MELPVDRDGVGPVCLVTGGNGYVGKHLIRRLLELGCEVRSLDLAPFRGDDLRVEGIVGDVRRFTDVRSACEGVDTVFHTAAVINTLTLARPEVRRHVYAVNVLGTECAIRACKDAGVKKLIFTSSIVVAVDGPIRDADETAPYVGKKGLPDLYSQTKSEAEKLVLAADDAGGLRTAAIRPGGVWGPGEGAIVVEDFLEHLASGRFKATIGDGTSVTDNVHIDSVVDAHFLAAQKLADDPDLVGGQAYFVSDGEPTNPVIWYRPIVEALGYPWPRVQIPRSFAYAIAYVSELAHYLGGPFPGLTRRGVLAVSRDASFRIDKARAHLGYEPRTSAAEGLPDLMSELRTIHDRMKSAR
ncbi:MAG: NAD-dependent epimerase/dehydratase family protein [Myxococcales bacterium]|nr:NAD-dependent epimerase/dehydratase family protein [Myxococcales bacterium]MDH3484904.1 NAD-dependent epimerase/dehydratase family protein [Myxococcales bacterium]